MASHVENEVDKNDNMLPSLRAISSNIDKMMSFDGFDIVRNIFQTLTFWQEIFPSLCNTPRTFRGQIYGSVGEGVIYPLNTPCDRDIDTVYVLPNNIAIENVHETHQYGSGTTIYLIENVSNRPGYCYLRVINEGSRLILLKTVVSLSKDVYGCKYFSGLALKETVKEVMAICKMPTLYTNDIRDICDNPNLDLEEMDQQGPATFFRFNAQVRNRYMLISLTKFDLVFVIHCPKWPSSALEWVKRRSRSGWPCQELKREIAQKGIFLAPVGCKKDPAKKYSGDTRSMRLK